MKNKWTTVLFTASVLALTAGCGVPRTLGGQSLPNRGVQSVVAPAAKVDVLSYGKDVPTPNVTIPLAVMPKSSRTPIQPATDLPKVNVEVTLPLYPGASPSSLPYPEAFASFPASPYLVTGKTEYLAPAATSDVSTWYRTHMAEAGYTFEGQGTSGNLKTGVHSEGLSFRLKSTPSVEVIVSLESNGDKETLVQYWVNDVLTPPRPANTMLPKDIQRIEVDYRPFGFINGKKEQHFTITDAKVIQSWVSRINGLSRDARGAHSCPADTGQHITLHCYTASGATRTVNLSNCGNVQVDNGPGLADNGVWAAIVSVIDPSHAS